jgi:hypothetical protein
MLRSANLAVKFILELVALGAFAYWGATVTSGVWAVVLAIATPLATGILWGRFAAPRAPRRLALRLRVPFELAVFALAALAGLTASTAAALAFALLVIVNSLLLTVFGQWETDLTIEASRH